MNDSDALLTLTPQEARAALAIFERLFPADDGGLGVAEIGVVTYLDRALAGAYSDHLAAYRNGLAALDRCARALHGADFAACAPVQQDALLAALERDELSGWSAGPGTAALAADEFFDLLLAHLQEGLFADPAYGGNRDKLGWTLLGHPGVWLENSAAENLSAEPVTKGGEVRSLADLSVLHPRPLSLTRERGDATNSPSSSSASVAESYLSRTETACDNSPLLYTEGAHVDSPRPRTGRGVGGEGDTSSVDVVLVGCGGMGGVAVAALAAAGLRVVALEAGPWREGAEFLPDELGTAYYCRAGMGPKFLSEIPRWRRNDGEPDREAGFSLGRMVNGVGGSIVHYGAWLRRLHPHHLRPLSHVRERWGDGALPAGCTLADWPVGYDELEPYYTQLEYLVGVAGDDNNPFVPRSRPYPMPPLRPFRLGEFFSRATAEMGLHPHAVPVGQNSVPYDGRPATAYSAWNNGFGSRDGDKWHPALGTVPAALADGNLDLRTGARVLRVLTDPDGHAGGVEYVDAAGALRVQRARTVILCAHTFENVRLLLLSGDARHPEGLGNNRGVVGKHFMTKMFAHVDGFFPETIFNRHTGPAAQGVVVDDYLAADFDAAAHGFIGGATLGAENQFLPLQISRESLPPEVPRWGARYRAHLRQWQHLGVVRIQPDALPYQSNYLDLHPRRRDRGGFGLPLVRVTYDLHANEHRLSEWMETRAAQILRAMGARDTWRGPRFTGVGSSHEMGGCRMGMDPATSVVDPELRVHDTPGLYVFGGAVLPSCPGINPTLTLWALCQRAADRLITRLRAGDEP